MRSPVVEITFKANGQGYTIKGRPAFALGVLLEQGETGATPITTPGPRWSDYIFKLRKLGLVIETRNESHQGPYPGHHANYILRTPVEVVKVIRAGEARDA